MHFKIKHEHCFSYNHVKVKEKPQNQHQRRVAELMWLRIEIKNTSFIMLIYQKALSIPFFLL